jgi:putative ABC transport system permease protein
MKLPSIKTLLHKFAQEPPLGWAQLSHQKVRLLVALSGIAFADILIFMRLGFYTSIFGGITRIHEHLQGDLVLVSSRAKFLADGQTFSRRYLYQAARVFILTVVMCSISAAIAIRKLQSADPAEVF